MYRTGFLKDPVDPRDIPLEIPPEHRTPGAPSLPPSVDLSDAYPPCLNQGASNSCTSNALANALLYALRLYSADGGAVPQSRLFIYWNGRVLTGSQGQDAGLNIRDAMKSVAKFNSVPETAWPFEPPEKRVLLEPSPEAKKLAALPDEFQYRSVPQDEASVKSALAQGCPVVLGILLLDSFYGVGKTGTFEMTGNYVGWHAVGIVGYDDSTRRFKLQNSWGSDWGANGFFYLPYAYVLDPSTASDLWAVQLFRDGATPSGLQVVIGLTDSKAVGTTDAGDVALMTDGKPTWTLTPTGCPATYTVRGLQGFLSAARAGGGVDLAATDDGSGRQRFKFTCINKKARVFTISVEHGLDAPNAKFLTATADGLKLERRRPASKGAATQQFKCANLRGA